MKKIGICFLGIPGAIDWFGGVRSVKIHPLRIAGLPEAKRVLPAIRN